MLPLPSYAEHLSIFKVTALLVLVVPERFNKDIPLPHLNFKIRFWLSRKI